jgi:predicted ATP-grasp superfamily ATP-dependent carboligase
MEILVAALSARSLAAAVRRGGEAVILADLFGDEDARRLGPWHPLGAGLATGIEHARLAALIERLGDRIAGVAWGAGFEQDDGLLEWVAERAPLLGNGPEIVRRVKDPFALAGLLARLGIPHPEIRAMPPGEAGWLRKRAGGSGGVHVAPAGTDADPGDYFQRRVEGEQLSALFLADGRRAAVLGFSRQWCAPMPGAPFRYGGCAGPVEPPPRLAATLGEAVSALVEATGLVGLNGADFLVDGNRCSLIEINPRPGATLDLFDSDDRPLWRLHRAAIAGELPREQSLARGCRAAAILYAEEAFRVPYRADWPDWTADRPMPGTEIAAGAPVCTVLAVAPTLDAATAAVSRRVASLADRLVATSPVALT